MISEYIEAVPHPVDTYADRPEVLVALRTLLERTGLFTTDEIKDLLSPCSSYSCVGEDERGMSILMSSYPLHVCNNRATECVLNHYCNVISQSTGQQSIPIQTIFVCFWQAMIHHGFLQNICTHLNLSRFVQTMQSNELRWAFVDTLRGFPRAVNFDALYTSSNGLLVLRILLQYVPAPPWKDEKHWLLEVIRQGVPDHVLRQRSIGLWQLIIGEAAGGATSRCESLLLGPTKEMDIVIQLFLPLVTFDGAGLTLTRETVNFLYTHGIMEIDRWKRDNKKIVDIETIHKAAAIEKKRTIILNVYEAMTHRLREVENYTDGLETAVLGALNVSVSMGSKADVIHGLPVSVLHRLICAYILMRPQPKIK